MHDLWQRWDIQSDKSQKATLQEGLGWRKSRYLRGSTSKRWARGEHYGGHPINHTNSYFHNVFWASIFCIYIFRVVYNLMMKCITYDNYSYIRVFIYIRFLSLIHPVKLKVELPPEAWTESKQTRLEEEVW